MFVGIHIWSIFSISFYIELYLLIPFYSKFILKTQNCAHFAMLKTKRLKGITLCKNLYWKLIRYIFLQHSLRIRKYIDQSAMSIPSISSHFKNFWMGRWVNVCSEVIYTNFKLFVYISLSKKSSFGWKFSVLILSMSDQFSV
jgi:hypothetical protein